ncbi:monofunctional biosynthetic peptidoglycan transglycosylase [Propionivibrio soli]|uniref:monofunctional biosynthetic peptidoglycan transglycosylase n=1 Tax=Propionivibrio soli TaxID=2976531 RepID=UPI0021E8CDBA|nr:monofunctional biosynthetic peptidoglycan transglycosylase [Propionivibrio soli]
MSGSRGAQFIARWLKRFILLVVGVLVLYQVWLFGWVLWWKWADPDLTRFMEIRLEELRTRKPGTQLQKQWVPYDRISVHLKRAVIAAEDDLFVHHGGFDWAGIQHAMERNRQRGKIVAGGSTISQQLAKNLFLTPAKTHWRKAEEALITVMIESVWSKRRIFEVYLNVIEWGDGIFGAEAAARHYFGTTAAQLAPQQAARLAGMVPSPRYYHRRPGAPGLANRAEAILGRMGNAQVP